MSSKTYLLSLSLLLGVLLSAQTIPVPKNYTIIDSILGDLDQDSVDELVVAYNMGPENNNRGVSRRLVIFKRNKQEWTEWIKSDQALYGSRDGGMMGDPFDNMEIKDGILFINHGGGSSWKWWFTDKYQYRSGELILIGYSSNSGKLCNDWKNIDFNLATGKITVKKEYEECETDEKSTFRTEQETFYKKGLEISIQERHKREIIITSPKYGHKIYLSNGRQ